MRRTTWTALLLVTTPGTTSLAAPPDYTVHDVHSEQPGSMFANSVAEAISSSGCFLCGMENDIAQSPLFIWDKTISSSVFQQIDDTTNQSWRFRDVNSSGIAVGSSIFTDPDHDEAYFWTGSGSLVFLNLNGTDFGRAQGINDSGTIVGCTFNGGCGNSTWSPVIWSAPSSVVTPTEVDTDAGALNNINAAGDQVVGWKGEHGKHASDLLLQSSDVDVLKFHLDPH